MTQSGKRYPENEVVGVAKWRIIRTINMVKVLPMRQTLQNSKGYAESPEFLPALGLLNRSLSLQLEVN